MKATFVNSILYILFVSAFAEKNRLGPDLPGSGRHYYSPKQLSPEEVNQSYNENTVGDGRSIIKGKTDESSCGEGGDPHHYHPCDEDVRSPETIDPISRSDLTFSPTPLPVGVPSNEPSISVNETLSVTATEAPGVTTTEAPGVTTTEAPSVTTTSQIIELVETNNSEPSNVVPDAVYSPSPSYNPTKMPCTTSDGTFGIISDTSLMTVSISYLYEMETISGTNQSIIDNEILPILEKAIVDSILQKVFPDRCGSTAIGKRKLRIQRRLEVTGLSMYPPDFITSDSICNMDTLRNPPANDCVVIDGELTLFTDDGQAVKENPIIDSLIKDNMNSGVYDGLSDKIVRLYYLDSSSDPTESNTGGAGNTINSNGNEGADDRTERKSLRVGLFVGLGALVAVLAGIVFRTARRMSINDDQTDMQSGGIQTYLDVDTHRSQSFT